MGRGLGCLTEFRFACFQSRGAGCLCPTCPGCRAYAQALRFRRRPPRCRAVGIQMAQADGMDWVLHVDTDELIYPSGSQDYSLQEVLADVSA